MEASVSLAIELYLKEKALAKAAELAGMTTIEFKEVIASRGVTRENEGKSANDMDIKLKKLGIIKSKEDVDRALKQYRKGKITIGKAAEMAGVSLREMIALAAKKGIPFQYSLDDLYEDVEAVESL